MTNHAKHVHIANKWIAKHPAASLEDLALLLDKTENDVNITLMSAAVRAEADEKREDLIDEAAQGIENAVNGLELFSSIAGSDIGLDIIGTIATLRQCAAWMRARDEARARSAFELAYSEALK